MTSRVTWRRLAIDFVVGALGGALALALFGLAFEIEERRRR